MLSGKILNIKWAGVWHVQIEGVRKIFNTDYAMNVWLCYIFKKVKDPEKKKLLSRDMSLIIKNEEKTE